MSSALSHASVPVLDQPLPPKLRGAKKRRGPKAVIFTHFGGLAYGANESELIAEYTEILKPYLECGHDGRIGIVYAYVSWAIQKVINAGLTVETKPNGARSFPIDSMAAMEEESLVGVLEEAENRARRALGLNKHAPPKFHYVKLYSLVTVLNNLIEADPKIHEFLCGEEIQPDGSKRRLFTYDSPKFVEAIIRLARGDIPHLARHPIIRVDEDAVVNSDAIDQLVEAFGKVTHEKPVFFFSGRYGPPGGPADPVNDHAVRVHWFYPEGTKAGDVRIGGADPEFLKANEQSTKFLADVGVLGAIEIDSTVDAENYEPGALLSLAMRNALKKDKSKPPKWRVPQVVSGAGLIMSRRAVEFLPPFMNFKHLTTWVDDHLKRRLHETLGDIAVDDIESVPRAKLRQDRHRSGISQADLIFAETKYFDRLLRGCIFHRMITEPGGSATCYSRKIRAVAWFESTTFDSAERVIMEHALMPMGLAHCRWVLDCWTSPEFAGSISHRWAEKLQGDDSGQQRLCEAVVEDALNYIDLLLKWPVFTRAIGRLSFTGNTWLYDEVA
jgi:hypothetical protein